MEILPPSFSVIIPNYNNGKTLRRAIESVLAQSYQAFEIIIIDDGSKDKSAEVAKSFGEEVRYFFQSNAGVSAARNHGAQIAAGNWLAFLDADDIYLPGRLKKHADWIKREPEIDFLLGDQEYRNPDGKLLHLSIEGSKAGRSLLERYAGALEIPLYRKDFEALIEDGFGEIRTLSIPREKFFALGGFPVGKKIGEDLYLLIKLCAQTKKAGVVTSPLAVYYIYQDSVLRKNILKAQKEFIETLDSLADEATLFPEPVRKGFHEKRRLVRLSLAYAHLRAGNRFDALKSVLPNLKICPGLRTVRDVFSIIRGLPRDQGVKI